MRITTTTTTRNRTTMVSSSSLSFMALFLLLCFFSLSFKRKNQYHHHHHNHQVVVVHVSSFLLPSSSRSKLAQLLPSSSSSFHNRRQQQQNQQQSKIHNNRLLFILSSSTSHSVTDENETTTTTTASAPSSPVKEEEEDRRRQQQYQYQNNNKRWKKHSNFKNNHMVRKTTINKRNRNIVGSRQQPSWKLNLSTNNNKAKAIIQEEEERIINDYYSSGKITKGQFINYFINNIIIQYCQLGESNKTEESSNYLLKQIIQNKENDDENNAHDKDEHELQQIKTTIKVYRHVLHSFCNEITRRRTRRRKSLNNNSRKENEELTILANKANEYLVKIENITTTTTAISTTSSNNKKQKLVSILGLANKRRPSNDDDVLVLLLLNAADYTAVIQAYTTTNRSMNAVNVLKRLEDVYVQSNYDTRRMTPTIQLYTTVIKSLANTQQGKEEPSPSQEEPLQQQQVLEDNNNNNNVGNIAFDIVLRCNELYKKSEMYYRIQPDIQLYNALIDTYSKQLPIPPKKSFYWSSSQSILPSSLSSSSSLTTTTTSTSIIEQQKQTPIIRQEQIDVVVNGIRNVWNTFIISNSCSPLTRKEGEHAYEVKHDSDNGKMIRQVYPNTKTYILMIYTYCKCNLMDDAYEMYESMMMNNIMNEQALRRRESRNQNNNNRNDNLVIDMKKCINVFINYMVKEIVRRTSSSSSSSSSYTSSSTTTSNDDHLVLLYGERINNIIISDMWKLYDNNGDQKDSSSSENNKKNEQQQQQQLLLFMPDLNMYKTAMFAWNKIATSSCSSNSDMAMIAIQNMKELINDFELHYYKGKGGHSDDDDDDDITIVDLYNELLHVVFLTAKKEAENNKMSFVKEMIQEIESIVKQMEKKAIDNNPQITPDITTYNTLIDSNLLLLLHSDDDNNNNGDNDIGIKRAEEILSMLTLRSSSSSSSSSSQVKMLTLMKIDVTAVVHSSNAGLPTPPVMCTPNEHTYESIIRARLVNRRCESIKKAERLLDKLEERFDPSPSLLEDIIMSYCHVVQQHQQQQREAETLVEPEEEEEEDDDPSKTAEKQQQQRQIEESAQSAQRLLYRMENLFYETLNDDMRPDMSLYTAVMKALSASAGSNSIHKASTVTAAAIEDVRQHRDRMYRPLDSGISSSNSIGSYYDFVRKVRFKSDNEVYALLDGLDDVEEGSVSSPSSSSSSARARRKTDFNHVLLMLSKSGKEWAGQRAEDVLDYMIEESQGYHGNTNAQPDIVSFNNVITAWARSSYPECGTKAEGVLQKLKSLHETGILVDVQPDRITYNSIINAYSKSKLIGSAREAERTFHELMDLYESTSEEQYRPDIVTYASLLDAWANSNESNAAERAEEILLRMQQDHNEDKTNVKPNTMCFNSVLNAWAKNSRPNDSYMRSEMILQLMKDIAGADNDDVQPDTQSYNIVLNSFVNNNNVKERDSMLINTQLLFEQMKEEGSAVKPDIVTYNTLIMAIAKHGRGKEASINDIQKLVEAVYVDENVEPGVIFYSNLINALSLLRVKGAARMADGVLEEMKEMSQNGTISAKPDTSVYNSLLNCWAKSGERSSGKRADNILNRMEEEYMAGNVHVKPDVQTYTSVLDALAKSRVPGSAEQAEKILTRMQDRYANGDTDVRPNVYTYTALIQNYAQSEISSKAVKAQSVLNRMKEDYNNGNVAARPNVVAYNAVLNAAEHTRGDDSVTQEAFKVACLAFDELRSSNYMKLNHISYGTFMGVCAELMPKSDVRNEMLELVFKRCCTDGQVGPIVLKKLSAASPFMYTQLLEGVSEKNLPSKWTCNVKERQN